MSYLALFLQGGALGITAGASPVPLQTYLISETLSGGWRRSLPLIFIPLLSDTPIIILTTFVLRQMPPAILRGVSLVGGLFVLYLAWGLWLQWRVDDGAGAPPHKLPRSYFKILALNLLNPNPYIFWTFVSGPLLLSAIEQSWGHALGFMAGFYAVFMGVMALLIVLFHQTRRLGPRVVRAIQLLSIVVLLVFGGILISRGVWG